jgi:hypothetical protein
MQWVSGGAFGKDFADAMGKLRREVTPAGEASFVEQLFSGAGSMASFFIPGFGVGRAASLMRAVAPRVARLLGAGTMAVTEAATEAGQVYRDEVEKGKDEATASSAASWTFALNLPVVFWTDKLAFFGNEGRRIARVLRGMVTEGTQESLQEVISTWSKEEQQNLKNILMSGAVGGIIGGGTGAISKPITKPPTREEVRKMAMDEMFGQAKVDWEGTKAIQTAKDVQRQNVLDSMGVGVPQEAGPLYKTPEVKVHTPEEKQQAIFGSRSTDLKQPRADAVRQLAAEVGG